MAQLGLAPTIIQQEAPDINPMLVHMLMLLMEKLKKDDDEPLPVFVVNDPIVRTGTKPYVSG